MQTSLVKICAHQYTYIHICEVNRINLQCDREKEIHEVLVPVYTFPIREKWTNGYVIDSSHGEIYIFIDGTKSEIETVVGFFSSNP